MSTSTSHSPNAMKHRLESRPLARARRGFSLVELMVVMIVLTIALGMFSSTMVSTARHTRMKRETALAAEGGRRALELMRSHPCTSLFALYNANPADDPGGAGTAPGANFKVAGLEPSLADGDGCVGEISFPTVGNALRESVVDGSMGMPRDLNGDQAVDDLNHAGDYVILPVRVRIRWKGVSGDMTFDMHTQYVKL
jgi:prepilin-type N-terminal cleavage/methylation domain-containing protein